MPQVRRSVVLTLALIVGLVPFASDMHLASLPEIGSHFRVPVWVTQLTLTGYLLLLGIGQLVAGPITDAVGRRRPLIWGLVLFIGGSVLAAIAPTIGALIAARVLQGIGGAISLVVANSSVRDRATGAAATRLYAVLLTVSALAPVLAPTVGGFLDVAFGWRSVFTVLAFLGSGALVATILCLPESLSPEARSRASFSHTLASYGRLFRQRAFAMPLAALATMFVVLFAYIGGASYVYQGRYGLDAATFGAVFGATGLSLMLGALAAGRASQRWGSRALAMAGSIIVLVGSALAVCAALLELPLWILVIGMALVLIGIGACEPALMGMSMSSVTHGSGGAAAVLGAAQYLLGSAATVAAGVIAAESAVGWTALLGASAVLALLLIFCSPRSAD